ncbi:hypothetical protein GCM10009646_83820 [Streptomyces aureus]
MRKRDALAEQTQEAVTIRTDINPPPPDPGLGGRPDSVGPRLPERRFSQPPQSHPHQRYAGQPQQNRAKGLLSDLGDGTTPVCLLTTSVREGDPGREHANE